MKPKFCVFTFSSPVRLNLLMGFLWTFVLPAQAQVLPYEHFQLKVDSQYVSARTFLMTIEAINVSEHHFLNGDVTVSFNQDVTCKVVSNKATTLRQFPKGSKIYSVEKDESILSDDLIVQALIDSWRPGQVVQLQLKLVVSELPLKILLRVAARLENDKALIFEPRVGDKDQQGLFAERFLMERLPLKCDIDGDGSEEVFVEWKRGRYGTVHHYQVFKRKRAKVSAHR